MKFNIYDGYLLGVENCEPVVVIPSGVTVIDDRAFYNEVNLKNITLPEGVKKISSLAFAGCTNLEEITLPSTLKIIGDAAFYRCFNLKDVYYKGNNFNAIKKGDKWDVDSSFRISQQNSSWNNVSARYSNYNAAYVDEMDCERLARKYGFKKTLVRDDSRETNYEYSGVLNGHDVVITRSMRRELYMTKAYFCLNTFDGKEPKELVGNFSEHRHGMGVIVNFCLGGLGQDSYIEFYDGTRFFPATGQYTKKDLLTELKKLVTDDYQNRGGNYPREGVPVSISYSTQNPPILRFSFKDTSVKTATSWVRNYLWQQGFEVKGLNGGEGDDSEYEDDWTDVEVKISDISFR